MTIQLSHPDTFVPCNFDFLPGGGVGGGKGGGQCHQDLLIYWTQWSIDLDHLLIQNEWLNIGATLILYDLVLTQLILLEGLSL